MKPWEQRETGQEDLFKARLDGIIDMTHPLVKLAGRFAWPFFEQTCGAVYTDDRLHPQAAFQKRRNSSLVVHNARTHHAENSRPSAHALTPT